MYILIGFFISIISLLFLLKERRSFIVGVCFIAGFLIFSLGMYIKIVDYLYFKQTNIASIFSLFEIIMGLLIPLFLLLFIIYSIYKFLKKERINNVFIVFIIGLLNFFFVIAGFFYFISGSYSYNLYSNIILILIILDFIFCICFFCFLLYSIIYQYFPINKKVSFIIVLGSGITSLKVPPLLQARLDKAILLYQNNNMKPNFIVSGGQGPDEPYSEAYAMFCYLKSKGISEDKIFLEEQSRNTYENMLFSNEIIKKEKINGDKGLVVFSTNNYHVLRASIYAKRANLKAEGQGSHTAFYFLPSALIREFIALLSMHKLMFILTILITTVVLTITLIYSN